jgi:hypothetical protein
LNLDYWINIKVSWLIIGINKDNNPMRAMAMMFLYNFNSVNADQKVAPFLKNRFVA